LDPKNIKALRDKGDALSNLDLLEEAVDIYNTVLDFNPKEVKTLQKKGRAQSRIGLYKEAQKSIDEALKHEKKDKLLWNDKAVLLTKMDEYDEAISCFNHALELDNKDENILTNKAFALYEAGRYDEALESFNSALDINATNIEALKGKGNSLIAKDEYESAIRCFDRVIDSMPEDIESWTRKAEAYMSLGRFEGAIGCYERAIELDERNKSHWINKGMLLDRTGKYDAALKSSDNALDLDDKDAKIWYRKGLTLSKMGELEAAINCYDRALGLTPDNKQIWTKKGIALRKLKNYEQALRCFEHALELDPKFMPAVEGKEKTERQIKKGNLERYARGILRFEKENKRPATKEEAFKICHIPYTYLDNVIGYLSEKEDVDINALSHEDRDRFERDSNRAIVSVLREDPASFEKYGLRLADIVFGFQDYDISQAKRLLAYINKADEMEMKVEGVDPELEETLNRALGLPHYQRNVNGLMQELNLGIFQAKKVYALLGQFQDQEVYTPEVRVKSLGDDYDSRRSRDYDAHPDSESYSKEPERVPITEVEDEPEEEPLCAICQENPVDITHDCGISLCKACISEYNEKYSRLHDTNGSEILCPKCGEEVIVSRKRGRKGKKGGEDYIRL
jgi:tetratricopeptide (TPR) repeat protein/predicted RNA-binding Zn-ribbon protein involved in translation (DUF1610 family)